MGRTITDEEISLIKAMLARRMKNADIQFFFNRPDRRVNSGRISSIANGSYSNSGSIEAATDEELDSFLEQRRPGAGVSAQALVSESTDRDPVSETALRGMFAGDASGEWRLKAGETDQAECKQSFSLRNAAAWLRAVAALANNRGGYVFFGVADKDAGGICKVVGLAKDDFRDADPAAILTRLHSAFEPTPRFQKAALTVAGKFVGVLHIEQHESRPVIAAKNDGNNGEIKEGDIFYRYPGASRRISYGDLRAILDHRDAKTRDSLLPMIQRVLELGPDRVMLADLLEKKITDGKTTIALDDEIVESLVSIKETGERKPSLRLFGNVMAATPLSVKKGIITRDELRSAFLADKLDADPLDYLRVAIQFSGSDWLPLRYFAGRAGMSRAETLAFIDGSPGPVKQKALCRDRLASDREAYAETKGPAMALREDIEAGQEIVVADSKTARHVAQAVQGLMIPLRVDPGSLRSLLSRCLKFASTSEDQNTRSAVRRAIARLDELMSPW